MTIESDATLAAIAFSQPAKQLQSNVTTPFDLAGFCNVKVPSVLLGGPSTVLVDGASVTSDVDSNATHTGLYLTVPSDGPVELLGTTLIPEIPTPLIMGFLLLILAAATRVVKRIW